MMKITIVVLLMLIAVGSPGLDISSADNSREVFEPIDRIIVMKTSQHIEKLDAAIYQLHVASKQYDSIKRMMIDTAFH